MDEYEEQLQLCEKIAREAHEGQKRRDGSDYVNHPLRVRELCGFESVQYQCVALLHDVIEDTKMNVEALRLRGVWEGVIYHVEILTKKDGVIYGDYIRRISEQAGAVIKIKIADMFDNLCDSPTKNQREKYRLAFKELNRNN